MPIKETGFFCFTTHIRIVLLQRCCIVVLMARATRVDFRRWLERIFEGLGLEPHAATWLRLNRQHWGIANGVHQRLDVFHDDDRCPVRNHNAMLVLAMMRRFSNSLFMHWRQSKRRPGHVTTTDFQSFLSEDHHCWAMRLVLANLPYFNTFMYWRWVGRLGVSGLVFGAGGKIR
jgi:hypothetical protein